MISAYDLIEKNWVNSNIMQLEIFLQRTCYCQTWKQMSHEDAYCIDTLSLTGECTAEMSLQK